MKGIRIDEYGQVRSIFYLNGKFLIFSLNNGFKIIVTDFMNYKRVYDFPNHTTVINQYKIFQYIDSESIYVNFTDENIQKILRGEGFKIISPPKFMSKYDFSKNNYIFSDPNRKEYTIMNAYFQKGLFITSSLKREIIKISESTYTQVNVRKISLHKEKKLINEFFLNNLIDKKNYKTKKGEVGNPHLMIMKISYPYIFIRNQNSFFVGDLITNKTKKYSYEFEGWKFHEFNDKNELLLSKKKSLKLIHFNENGIEYEVERELKGYIKTAKFIDTEITVIYTWIIDILKIENLKLIKQFHIRKMLALNIFRTSENSFLIHYLFFDKKERLYVPAVEYFDL